MKFVMSSQTPPPPLPRTRCCFRDFRILPDLLSLSLSIASSSASDSLVRNCWFQLVFVVDIYFRLRGFCSVLKERKGLHKHDVCLRHEPCVEKAGKSCGFHLSP